MGLFKFGKNKNNQNATPATPAPSPVPVAQTPSFTAEQYLAAGHKLRAAQNWSDAMECYKAAANMGNAEGLYWLGNCVLTGKGAVKDDLLACKLYGLAAKQRHVEATNTLFKYLEATISDSLKNNDFGGLSPYLQVGADAGHIQSVYLYGYFLTLGAGNLPQNKQEGYKWIKLAADNGYALAQEALAKYF